MGRDRLAKVLTEPSDNLRTGFFVLDQKVVHLLR